jgi:hypothetical protein
MEGIPSGVAYLKCAFPLMEEWPFCEVRCMSLVSASK